MIFFYILLAHLVSDYLLQPDNLVEWKKHSRWGLFMHSFIHFLFTTLILFLYTGQPAVAILAFIMAALHFIIDYAKAVHDLQKDNTTVYYWLDQLAHYLSAGLVTLIALQFGGFFARRTINFGNYFDLLFFNPVFVTFASLVIFMTLTIEYSHFKYRSKAGHRPLLNKRNMIRRLLLAAIIYVGLLFALVPSVGLDL